VAEPVWARRTADGWTLAVHVQPGAKRSAVAGLHGERLKLRIAAPALDGRANDALVAVAKGAQSREKLLVVSGECDPAVLLH
jgi:uncharacterized protein